MDREGGGDHNVSSVYVYNGVDEVPRDVTYVRVDQSVTIIPEGAFRDRQNLKVVELPEGLIRIENDAFENCPSLMRINIPSTVEEIGDGTFSECLKLDDIVLPDELQRLGPFAFYECISLQRINIPSGIKEIKGGTFLNCDGLQDIAFSEGLEVIGKDAFSGCKSLESVTLPSTIQVIGEESFERCLLLNEVHMPDAIESIRSRAFKNCNITNFRMPSQETGIDSDCIMKNNCLVSLELPENIQECYIRAAPLESLRNVTFPVPCGVNDDANDRFDEWTDMFVAFPDKNGDTILDALQKRFDELPIHKICYYQSYHDTETTMQNLKREINPWTSKPPGQLNTSGKEQDCLGMTPLHILACSIKQNVEIYQLLIEKYPDTLIMKDKWGDIPLQYAIWCNAPPELVNSLVESCKTLHPDYEFDWKGMILTLAKRDVPLANIQKLVNTQQSSFSDQEYDMQHAVTELAADNAIQAGIHFSGIGFSGRCTSIETFRYMLQISVYKRLDLLSVSKWCEDLKDIISNFPEGANKREAGTKALYDRLDTYESIKEGTPVLELALWRAKLDEGRNKRARTDDEVSYREQCRINCRADIIIRNVLPYLLPE